MSSLSTLLRDESKNCWQRGSPLYGTLLEFIADDVEANGLCCSVLSEHEQDPVESVLALRFLSGVHFLVLNKLAPELVPYYPSVGGSIQKKGLQSALLSVVKNRGEHLRQLIKNNYIQTNEVGRSAALMGGFLQIAKTTGLPLSLLEIGASAGLNLYWDYYYYQSGDWSWGNPNSPVHLCDNFTEAYPAERTFNVKIVKRKGCDLNPLDPRSDVDRLTLLSCIWADRIDRINLLRSAFNAIGKACVSIDKAEALQWLPQQLTTIESGTATVVFHSIMLQYLSKLEQQKMNVIMEEAGSRATKDSPLAWLRMEPPHQGAKYMDIRLTLWPNGDEELLGIAEPYGKEVIWNRRSTMTCG